MENCAEDLLEWSSAAANVAENTVPSSRTATRLASLMLLFISLSSDEFLCSWSGGRAGTDFWITPSILQPACRSGQRELLCLQGVGAGTYLAYVRNALSCT